jgi:hypothetical protein
VSDPETDAAQNHLESCVLLLLLLLCSSLHSAFAPHGRLLPKMQTAGRRARADQRSPLQRPHGCRLRPLIETQKSCMEKVMLIARAKDEHLRSS